MHEDTEPEQDIMQVNVMKNKSLEPSIKKVEQQPQVNVQPQQAPNIRQVSMFDLFGVETNDENNTPSNTFEFSVSKRTQEEPQPIAEPEPPVSVAMPQDEDLSEEEIMRRNLQLSRERIMKLKNLSIRLNSNGGLNELESVPAYVRKNMKLKETPHSSEQHISRFTLSDDNDGTEIRPNNSFLHDNVD